MSRLQVTLACGPYDRTEALRNGVVRPEAIDLVYVPVQSPPELFARMVHKMSFDAAEMSTSLYLQLRSRGDLPLVALPIFPSRMFRHGYVFIHAASGISQPADLAGKRIGVQEYHQTAGVWIRGILARDYGVDFSGVSWFEGGVNAPRKPDPAIDLRPEGPLDITFVGTDVCLDELLASGRIDAYLGARTPRSFGTNPAVRRLFDDPRAEERAWFQRTGVFPMMHTLVVREELLARHPWIAESLYKAFEEAKRWCLQQMRFSGASRYTLPWLQADLEEIDELFGGDPWPYGLEPNRAGLETLAAFLSEQRFLPEPPAIDELFVPLVVANE
ncbi:MAG: ABC transporter substrate-binding protein [Nitriliruptorales bacterium]|nr:ABC transporter substrate-binding protein [Nitriliruptorales bacterium]